MHKYEYSVDRIIINTVKFIITSVSVSGGVQALSNAIAVAIMSQQSPGTVTSPLTIATGGTANPGQASQGGHSNSSGAQGVIMNLTVFIIDTLYSLRDDSAASY